MPDPVAHIPSQSAIPANPEMAAMVAAAIANSGAPASPSPTQSHQGNPMIPAVSDPVLAPQGQPQGRPAVQQQSSAPPARGAQQDWFSSEGLDEPSSGYEVPTEALRPAAPPVVPQPPVPDEFQGIEDLLRDFGPAAAPEPQQPNSQAVVPPPTAQAPTVAAPPQLSAEELTTKAIDELMGRHYQIDEATSRRLISEPETVLPRLAAQVHINAVRDVGRVVRETLPQMIAAGVQQEIRAMRNEMEFFGKYPTLNRDEFKPFVAQALTFVRQNNPNIDRSTLMTQGAVLAANLIRSQRRPAAPSAPQMRAPVAPHVPATAHGGVSVPQNPQGQAANPFTDLANDPTLFDF